MNFTKSKLLSAAMLSVFLLFTFCTDGLQNNDYYTLVISKNPITGGTVVRDPDEASYERGTKVTVTAEAAEGYRFVSWSGASNSTDSSVVITVNTNTTLTANFQALVQTKQFTVTFNTDGGIPATISPVTVDSGKTIGSSKFPEDPEKIDRAFDGWFDGAVKYDSSTIITKNVTLKANWSDTTVTATTAFTVTFDTDGGTPATISPVTVDSGKTIGSMFPDNPRKTGYIFDGWYNDGVEYDSSTVITKNVTLTAEYIVKTFTVRFDTDGGSPETIPPVVVDSGEVMGTNFPAAPTKTGLVFIGWFDGVEEYDASTVITKNVTLKANFVRRYFIAYSINGGTGAAPDTQWVNAGSSVTFASGSGFTMSGYAFAGWGTSPVMGSGTTYNAGASITPSANLSLYAKWNVAFTLTVNRNPSNNAGSISVGGDNYTQAITIPGWTSVSISVAANTVDGYVFGKWTVVSGDASFGNENSASTTVTLSSNATIAANFYGSLTDTRDNDKKYRTVKIGDLIWMAENLNYETANGSRCFGDDANNCAKYGRLYDLQTALSACPIGWRLPENSDWQNLTDAVGGNPGAGTKLKSKTGWDSWICPEYMVGSYGCIEDNVYSGNGTDDFGFSALPGGVSGNITGSTFHRAGSEGNWWSSTEEGSGGYTANVWRMLSDDTDAHRSNNLQTNGSAVRCVQD